MSDTQTPPQTQPTEANGNGRKKRIGFLVFGAVVAVGLVAGYVYLGYMHTHVSSDDAFVAGTVHTVAPRVSGVVNAVAVTDDQHVKEGDLLVEIDPDIYRTRVADAEASAAAEQRRVEELNAAVAVRRTSIAAAKAVIEAREADRKAREAQKSQADLDLKRAQSLYDKKVVSAERLERAHTAFDTAQASLDAASDIVAQSRAALRSEEALLRQSEASIESQRQMVLKREAQAEQERLQLSYTRVLAPSEGFVTRKAVEVGNHVQPGQPLMSVVSLADAYILANYKETELHSIRPGMAADIKLDAYPEKSFKGHVESIMSGTGSAFTLFPPENASGNYVKVVQRVPVKIVFDDLPGAMPFLRVGMSAVPTILTAGQ